MLSAYGLLLIISALLVSCTTRQVDVSLEDPGDRAALTAIFVLSASQYLRLNPHHAQRMEEIVLNTAEIIAGRPKPEQFSRFGDANGIIKSQIRWNFLSPSDRIAIQSLLDFAFSKAAKYLQGESIDIELVRLSLVEILVAVGTAAHELIPVES